MPLSYGVPAGPVMAARSANGRAASTRSATVEPMCSGRSRRSVRSSRLMHDARGGLARRAAFITHNHFLEKGRARGARAHYCSHRVEIA